MKQFKASIIYGDILLQTVAVDAENEDLALDKVFNYADRDLENKLTDYDPELVGIHLEKLKQYTGEN